MLLIAFLVVGPKDLPRVARWLGRQVKKLRSLIREVKRETGWDELEREARDVRQDVQSTASQLDVCRDVTRAAQDVEGSLREAADAAREKEN